MTEQRYTAGPAETKPTAYAFIGPDGLHFVNLKPAAEFLKADYQALRYAATQLCAGIPIRTPAAELIRTHFPELASPRRLVEPGTVAI